MKSLPPLEGDYFLASLLVRRVATLPLAVLLHLNTLTIVHLVLHRDVIATLALLAGQGHLDSLFVLSHHFSLTTLVLLGLSVLPGSGGGSRTRDTTIMSRVL